MRISRSPSIAARHLWLLLAAGVGCGGPPRTPVDQATPVRRQPTRILPRDSVVVLEAWGASPNDTSVSFALRSGRVIILRHGPPDNTVFAELRIPPDSSVRSDADSVRLSVSPRPGLYGVDIEASRDLSNQARDGITLTFKYPVHFAPPVELGARYGNRVEFERALVVGRVLPDRRVAFLPSTQPASDNLAAEIPGPGRYLVVAPR